MAALVGGWDGKTELSSVKLLIFDDSQKGMRWQPLEDMPAPVVNPAVCADSSGSRLLVAGGRRGAEPLRDVLAWDASSGWQTIDPLRTPRDGGRAVRQQNGQVLVLGGSRGSSDLASAEFYDEDRRRWMGAPGMLTARRNFGAAVMPDGRIVVAGGFGGGGPVSAVASDMTPSPHGFASWLGAAQCDSSGPAAEVMVSRSPVSNQRRRLASAEVFDPASDKWTALPDMCTHRDGCTMCVLSRDAVGVFGGCGNGVYQSTCEVFSFAARVWSSLPSMSVGRAGCCGVLGPGNAAMPYGLPIVLGGACDENPAAIEFLKSVECLDLSTGKHGEWKIKPEMSTARQWAGLCQFPIE